MLQEKYDITDRLYISSIAENCASFGNGRVQGLEVADFCTAQLLEYFEQVRPSVDAEMRGFSRYTMHMPFNELTPCAIDPAVVDLTAHRYEQGAAVARQLGIKRLIVHSGYTPLIYYKVWFVQQAIVFWKRYLRDKPDDVIYYMENVMEDEPQMDVDVIEGVDDPRLRLCLDVGHANTRVSDTPWQVWMDTMAPYLGHLHIHNNDGDWDLHDTLGHGVLPMEELLRHAVDVAPDATFAIENAQPEESLQWLEERGFIHAEDR